MPLVEIIVPSIPNNVPAFLAKLWKMVENQDTDDYICWTEDGTSFRIRDQSQFASCLLPYYYKHSNMASFVRQLNMYGFHKVIALHSGNLKNEKEEIEFAHVFFIRGQEHLLDQIKRKSSSNSKSQTQIVPGIKKESVFITQIDNSDKEEMVNEILVEMSQMKEKQEDLDNKLENMKSENEALWGEVLSLRQKHNQQQKIVNKLIQFLVALVQPRISKGIKRKRFRHPSFPSHQLALESGEGSPPSAKEAKVEEIADEISSCHLSDLLTSGCQQEESEAKCKYTMVDPATVTPSIRQIKVEKSQELMSPSKLVNNTAEDFDPDGLQRELDSLKDILTGQITLDTSIMSGLLSPDTDSLINGMKLVNDSLIEHTEEDSTADLKFLTYSSSMNQNILALAAESSGINLEDDLLSTPPRSFDMETSILS